TGSLDVAAQDRAGLHGGAALEEEAFLGTDAVPLLQDVPRHSTERQLVAHGEPPRPPRYHVDAALARAGEVAPKCHPRSRPSRPPRWSTSARPRPRRLCGGHPERPTSTRVGPTFAEHVLVVADLDAMILGYVRVVAGLVAVVPRL